MSTVVLDPRTRDETPIIDERGYIWDPHHVTHVVGTPEPDLWRCRRTGEIQPRHAIKRSPSCIPDDIVFRR